MELSENRRRRRANPHLNISRAHGGIPTGAALEFLSRTCRPFDDRETHPIIFHRSPRLRWERKPFTADRRRLAAQNESPAASSRGKQRAWP